MGCIWWLHMYMALMQRVCAYAAGSRRKLAQDLTDACSARGSFMLSMGARGSHNTYAICYECNRQATLSKTSLEALEQAYFKRWQLTSSSCTQRASVSLLKCV